MTQKRAWGRTARILAGLLLLFALTCYQYLSDYYRADAQAYNTPWASERVERLTLEDNPMVYLPEEPKAGLIFYPGGKVEYTAYIPLMEACAAQGILCVLVELPFHLAVLDMNAAEGIQAQYPAVESWYMAGHSLGGAMAASYLAETDEKFDGLVLLGAYSAVDLSESGLQALSLYGNCDQVLDREKYEECRANLPIGYVEVVLEGAVTAGLAVMDLRMGMVPPLSLPRNR